MKETCVLCGKKTKYDRDLPIQYRSHYVEGAGQLCDSCFDEVYKIKTHCLSTF